jgi:hypothetical protein
LRNGVEVGRNEKTIWDLGFETSETGCHVFLNGSKSMFALKTGKTDFGAVGVTDTIGQWGNMKWDSYTGSADSTAIGDWWVLKPVYVIDRGFNELGLHLGYAKMQVLDVSKEGYTIEVGTLGGNDAEVITILKDTLYSLAYISLTGNKQVIVAPPKADWDIAFTQYTHIFYDEQPPVPYLVTGCLLNRYGTLAYADTTHQFPAFDFSFIRADLLTTDISSIGYNWKVFDGTQYAISSRNCYVVRTAAGVYYKLRFTGFYNISGEKGNPKWEYQQL